MAKVLWKHVSYQAIASYLVEEKGYDSDLLKPFDPDFCTRGLVLDVELGNLLKLAEDGTIVKATHGTRFLSDDEIAEYYGDKKHWPLFEDLINAVDNIGERFRIFENFFDIPGSLLCARLVDLADREAPIVVNQSRKYSFFKDVIDAYNDAYHHTQYDKHQGRYFPPFKTETEKFLQKCSQDVKDWLKRLRKDGRKTFIMTSSFVDFASYTMEFVLGSDWKEYFDYFLFLAKKPSFFSGNRNFFRIDGISECEHLQEIKDGQFVTQGNHKTFIESLSKAVGKEKPKVIYFGDSLRSDIFPSKRHAAWDTVMILEEMDAEIGTLFPDITFSNWDSEEPEGKNLKLMGPSNLEKEYLTSKKWGSLFTDDHQATAAGDSKRLKCMNTLWGYMIRKYADVAVPCLEAITDSPLELELPVFNHETPRQWGFYPQTPRALQCNTDKDDD
ncbi:hypothetical protein LSH36_72g03100 [Paralvinella palmiformis]|uniref:5'-nucleotidase domain-containing protein 1 n=1 Tax=Paralvinella palmiformis TaxID=53620 RepID=A0AAD9K2V4_9ANNE|nr:hypothetical protein LSH36_72g03100 [Paralvinella palmiformis]